MYTDTGDQNSLTSEIFSFEMVLHTTLYSFKSKPKQLNEYIKTQGRVALFHQTYGTPFLKINTKI